MSLMLKVQPGPSGPASDHQPFTIITDVVECAFRHLTEQEMAESAGAIFGEAHIKVREPAVINNVYTLHVNEQTIALGGAAFLLNDNGKTVDLFRPRPAVLAAAGFKSSEPLPNRRDEKYANHRARGVAVAEAAPMVGVSAAIGFGLEQRQDIIDRVATLRERLHSSGLRPRPELPSSETLSLNFLAMLQDRSDGLRQYDVSDYAHPERIEAVRLMATPAFAELVSVMQALIRDPRVGLARLPVAA